MQILHSYPLIQHNTLRLNSQAKYFIALQQLKQLPEIFNFIAKADIAFLVLGGGSNLILPPIYSGVVIHNQLKGIAKIAQEGNTVLIKAMAGEIWDEFVLHTLTQGWFGLENLSLIPGTVGAGPIQNIGAYGVEVKDFVEYVEVYDIQKNEFTRLYNQDCHFSYRNSRFKQQPNFLITAVVFRLNLRSNLNLSYGELHQRLGEVSNLSALAVRQWVIQTRQSKLPDPQLIGNVGSFFHNPILPTQQTIKLQHSYPNLPVYPLDPETAKVSAGWLIDNLGLKGYRLGNVGVYDKQALVLVNYAQATQAEILTLARLVQDKVFAHYGIGLNIEPIIIPEPASMI
jgi:UDP-N-acetylmuramate dehydrogenase